jgi:hypothetical protein
LLTAGLSALVLGAGLSVPLAGSANAAEEAAVTVDFTQKLRDISSKDFGATITGYGAVNGTIVEDATHRALINKLGTDTLRFELAYDVPGDKNSKLRCGAEYCRTGAKADDWIDTIRGMDAEPLIILPMDRRHEPEVDRTDAVNIYRHFADRGVPLKRFIVGNEPDNANLDRPMRFNASDYSSRFNMIADALHAIDPAIKVGGPATVAFNSDFMDTFLQTSGGKVDFVDFHKYPQGGSKTLSDEVLLGDEIARVRTDVQAMRNKINQWQPGRSGQIDIVIGELNLDWDGLDGRLFTSFNMVWNAAAFGTALTAGATPIQYGDRNGGQGHGLGLVSEEGEGGIPINKPLPIYHGIGAFTGAGLFDGFGTKLVKTTSANANVEVFASTDKQRVVLVNKSTQVLRAIPKLTGLTNFTADVWQSTGDTPAKTEKMIVSPEGWAGVDMPGRSVTTLVFDTGTPPPTPANGLAVTYYNNQDFTGSTVTRFDPTVDFNWAEGSPDPAIDADTFSARWTGKVQIDEAGAYVFSGSTDDGSRLFIDGTQVFADWTDHHLGDTTSNPITLTAGKHTIKYEYYENGWDAEAHLSWTPPGKAKAIIPTSKLSP